MCKKIKTKQEINVCGEYALLFREHACHGTHFKSEDNFEMSLFYFYVVSRNQSTGMLTKEVPL